MGFYYFNAARFDRTMDIDQPEALIFAPTGDGNRRLVAVEYFLVDADQSLTTNEAPTLFEQQMQGPMNGHMDRDNPTNPAWMPRHYDLHVWVWEANTDGTFQQWNPSVSCAS